MRCSNCVSQREACITRLLMSKSEVEGLIPPPSELIALSSCVMGSFHVPNEQLLKDCGSRNARVKQAS